MNIRDSCSEQTETFFQGETSSLCRKKCVSKGLIAHKHWLKHQELRDYYYNKNMQYQKIIIQTQRLQEHFRLYLWKNQGSNQEPSYYETTALRPEPCRPVWPEQWSVTSEHPQWGQIQTRDPECFPLWLMWVGRGCFILKGNSSSVWVSV